MRLDDTLKQDFGLLSGVADPFLRVVWRARDVPYTARHLPAFVEHLTSRLGNNRVVGDPHFVGVEDKTFGFLGVPQECIMFPAIAVFAASARTV